MLRWWLGKISVMRLEVDLTDWAVSALHIGHGLFARHEDERRFDRSIALIRSWHRSSRVAMVLGGMVLALVSVLGLCVSGAWGSFGIVPGSVKTWAVERDGTVDMGVRKRSRLAFTGMPGLPMIGAVFAAFVPSARAEFGVVPGSVKVVRIQRETRSMLALVHIPMSLAPGRNTVVHRAGSCYPLGLYYRSGLCTCPEAPTHPPLV